MKYFLKVFFLILVCSAISEGVSWTPPDAFYNAQKVEQQEVEELRLPSQHDAKDSKDKL